MNSVLLYVVLIIITIVLLFIYGIYVFNYDKKQRKYYKYKLFYDTQWDMYDKMVRKQKRIVFSKRLELIGLTILVKIKRLFV